MLFLLTFSITHSCIFFCNISVFDHPQDRLCPPLNNWPRQLGGLQVRWWRYNREEIGMNDFCAQQIRSKKIHLSFYGLRNVATISTTLEHDFHQNVKKKQTTASTMLAHHYWILTASIDLDCFKGRCRTPYVLIWPPMHVSNPFLYSVIRGQLNLC